MNLHGRDLETDSISWREEPKVGGRVDAGNEHAAGLAVGSREDCGAQVGGGANKVFRAHENVGEEDAEQDRHDPSADEAFNGLLGGELDELGATESDTADVGKNVVGDDESGGQEEPNHALKDIVHDEVSLNVDEEQGHVRPGELRELELEVVLLERADEENESWKVSCWLDEPRKRGTCWYETDQKRES